MTRNGDCHVQRNYTYACKWSYSDGQNYFPFSISNTTKIYLVVQRAWCLSPFNFRILSLEKFWPGFLPFPWWLPLSSCSVDDYLVNFTSLKLSWMCLQSHKSQTLLNVPCGVSSMMSPIMAKKISSMSAVLWC